VACIAAQEEGRKCSALYMVVRREKTVVSCDFLCVSKTASLNTKFNETPCDPNEVREV
jgi:hypothetical protein